LLIDELGKNRFNQSVAHHLGWEANMTTIPDFWRENFNADGASFGDLFLHDSQGHNAIWLMDSPGGNQLLTGASLPTTATSWHIRAAADFDDLGPNFSDVLWQNDNGLVAIWQMVGTTILSQQNLQNVGPNWHANFANDFNGDTSADILFQHDNGMLAIWTMLSGGVTGPFVSGQFNVTQNPGPAWHAAATGDTDGDGRAGIVFQNDNGLIAIWENATAIGSNVGFQFQATLQNVGPAWDVEGMGDFNGDLRADILFQNDNGMLGVWLMGGPTGTTVLGQFNIAQNPGPAWDVVGVRDMNSDGRADVVFQNSNGMGAVWDSFAITGANTATFVEHLNFSPQPNGSVLDWIIF
jgi:serralysin